MITQAKQAAINEKLSETFLLGIMINNHTDYCAFIDFAGHVNSVSFRICESKSNWMRELINDDFYLDKEPPAKVMQKIDKVIELFKDILEKNRIDYGKIIASRKVSAYRVFKRPLYMD